MKKWLILVLVIVLLAMTAMPVIAATGVTPPGYGGGGAEPGTGATGDGDPPGWTTTCPGLGCDVGP